MTELTITEVVQNVQMTIEDGGQQVTLSVVDSRGPKGVGVASMAIDGSYHLIITYTDTTTEDVGLIPGIGGDVVGPASSADNEVALFDGTTGKLIKGGGILGSASQANSGDFTPVAHVGSTGAAHGAATTGVNGFMTTTQVTKLDGIATGATANSADATLLDRTNHTGEQAISTVTGLQTELDDKQDELVSGTNIKTINGAPVLGAGDLVVSAAPSPVITESTTARILALSDASAYIRHTNAGASTVTVPPQTDVTWVADTEIYIRRAAAGNLTLTPGSGVTLNAPSGGTLVLTDGMSVGLKRVAENVWDVVGQTVAV